MSRWEWMLFLPPLMGTVSLLWQEGRLRPYLKMITGLWMLLMLVQPLSQGIEELPAVLGRWEETEPAYTHTAQQAYETAMTSLRSSLLREAEKRLKEATGIPVQITPQWAEDGVSLISAALRVPEGTGEETEARAREQAEAMLGCGVSLAGGEGSDDT